MKFKHLKCQNDKTNTLSYRSREFDINVLTYVVQKTSNCRIYEYFVSETKYRSHLQNLKIKHSLAPEDYGRIFCTKIQISLARSFSKTKFEYQGINLAWPYLSYVGTSRPTKTSCVTVHAPITSLKVSIMDFIS